MKITSTLNFETPLTAKFGLPIKNSFTSRVKLFLGEKSSMHNNVALYLIAQKKQFGGRDLTSPTDCMGD